MNNIPDKFWNFAAQYAPELTEDDVKQLETIAKEQSVDRLSKYLKGFPMPEPAQKPTTSSTRASPVASR